MKTIFYIVNKQLRNPKLLEERKILLREVQNFILSARWEAHQNQAEKVFFILKNGISNTSIKWGTPSDEIEALLQIASKQIYSVIGADSFKKILSGNNSDYQDIKTRLFFLNHPITSTDLIMSVAFPLNPITYSGSGYRLEECSREIRYISRFLCNVVAKERTSLHWDRFSFLINLLDTQNFELFNLKLKLINRLISKEKN